MKQLFVIGVLGILLSSCSNYSKVMVNTSRVNHPVIESTTMATISVDKKRISYTYVPTKQDTKALTEEQLIQNAIYMALSVNGNADVLVKVNTFVTYKKVMLIKRIKSISVSGYPARYVNFREPTDEDLNRVSVFLEPNKNAEDGKGWAARLFNR